MKICFVIAPIGDPDSDVRKHPGQVLKHIIEPAAKQCGHDQSIADLASSSVRL